MKMLPKQIGSPPHNGFQSSLLGTLFMGIVLSVPVINSMGQVVILEPPELSRMYPSQKITGSTAAFGSPYYGQRLTGEIKFFETDGCDDNSYRLSSSLQDSSELKKIVAVRRGMCHFVTKVQVAQAKGAIAVLIFDDRGSRSSAEDVQKIIMADDGWGEGVTIPSILIGEVDAIPILESLSKGPVVIELAWDIPKNDSVKMDLWLSPAISQSTKFVQEYSDSAMALKHKLDFRPHYWVMSLPSMRNFKDMCVDEAGHYCGLDPDWGGSVTGRDIVEESVRQICLWEITQDLDQDGEHTGAYSESWWSYMQKISEVCPQGQTPETNKFSETCSYELMKKLNVNVKNVQQCYNNRFTEILERELQSKAWSPLALMINDWRFSGPLDAAAVHNAVCNGFNEIQSECKGLELTGIFGNKILAETKPTGFPLWAVILIAILAASLSISAAFFVFWKCFWPKIRSNMRYFVMNEARKATNAIERDNFAFNRDSRNTSLGSIDA